MAARSIASLSLSFGPVPIPTRVFAATESSAAVRFNLLTPRGSRMRQQYVSEKTRKVVTRSEMAKGYEFEKDRYVIFEPQELKAQEEGASHPIEIVSFLPEHAIDPIYYDEAHFLAPDKRGAKPSNLPAPRCMVLALEVADGAGAIRRFEHPAAADGTTDPAVDSAFCGGAGPGRRRSVGN